MMQTIFSAASDFSPSDRNILPVQTWHRKGIEKIEIVFGNRAEAEIPDKVMNAVEFMFHDE